MTLTLILIVALEPLPGSLPNDALPLPFEAEKKRGNVPLHGRRPFRAGGDEEPTFVEFVILGHWRKRRMARNKRLQQRSFAGAPAAFDPDISSRKMRG